MSLEKTSSSGCICLSVLPVEVLLVNVGTGTSKCELDPVLDFSLKTTEEVVSDSGN